MHRGLTRQSGFTLIEIVIALSVAIILGAIAIPGYSGFTRQQELNSSVQQLAGCLQRGQSEAAAPVNGSQTRFSGAVITHSGTDTLTCAVSLYDNSTSITSLLAGTATATALAYRVTINPVGLVQVYPQGNSAKGVSAPEAVSVYFGTLEGGKPVAYLPCANTTQLTDGCQGTAKNVVPTGSLSQGFTLLMTVNNGANGDKTQTLTMGQLGIPIRTQ